MRIFLAMAIAASLFVAAGCSCATGDCKPVKAVDCGPCEAAPVVVAAPAPVVIERAPAPAIAAAPVVSYTPPVETIPVAVAPITCNPCAGL